MEWFSFTAPTLLPVFAIFGDKTAPPLQFERPAKSREEVAQPDEEGDVLRAKASSGVELCLKEGPLLVYGEKEPPAAKIK